MSAPPVTPPVGRSDPFDYRDVVPPLDHVILTRFSVVFVPEQPPASDDWLRYRWAFFEEATIASLESQSVQSFRWLVFLDDRAPTWLRERMSAAAGPFEPVYLSGPFTVDAVRRAIGSDSASPLLTTRLDSDDALGIRFVETVQREATTAIAAGLDADGLYLNATRGLQLERSGRIYRYDYASNPFLSFVETRTPSAWPRTVFQDGRHGGAREHAPVRSIRAEPLWLQVVHGSNLMNDIRGVRVHPRAAERSFDVALGFRRDVPPLRLVTERLVSMAALVLLWLRHPGLGRQAVVGRVEYLLGTRTRPRRRR
ncbi:glycosyltransferase [Rathayibacter iranicus]|uniref:Rhamnosyltransferase n=1 Tax=Rathayibacter iranicus NCPPB 2253 = VKM Ac-1602 TaxID=1328868 RepID=A0ABX5LEW3_9MICO|nr:glycosyltransferase [Rathayibacter iranicus]MWV30901.1 hypothetical protein [Rathayibacter iranicus NCPPB 2253 = VKM Ac-1602]PWJ65941.1 putative rhamnosyltransferase [Rathayibacter iranicus NCPPB 2253 = VKM Ac-1602]